MSNAIYSLDIHKLGDYLETQLEGFVGLREASKFAGGQSNPTFLLSAKSGKYVLRRKPPGELLKSAHAVDREFRVIRALADTEVPVARALHLCKDDTVIGSMFYIMSFEEGRIFWDAALPELNSSQRGACYRETIRVLAVLHSVDVVALGLGDFGRPGNYFERQIGRWSKQYRAAETHTIAPMEALLQWLPANIPADDGQVSLIHGDYCLSNVMFDPVADRIKAVLDWELSTLGHPLADLAYYCMRLRLPSQGDLKGLAGSDRDALGIPGEAAIIAHYCELRGVESIDDWHFYLIFSFFRLASICQGVYKRALGGNASNEKALELGKSAEVLAAMATELM